MSVRGMTRCVGVAVLLWSMLSIATNASAQLNGQNIKGDVGLKAGSQAPPGGYVIVPLYWYSANEVRNRNGDVVLEGSLDTFVGGAGLNYVTPHKLGAASYGFLVVLPVANNRLQGTEIDQNPGAGLTDLYVQPISLGWHFTRADVTAGYGVFIPIGRYHDGASNNTGLGMWMHEFLFGGTAYLDPGKAWHASTLASFDFPTTKRNSEVKPGNILNLEGGVGRDFLKGAASAGVAYYGTFKLTDDHLAGLPGIIVRGRNRIGALGPEVTLPLAAHKTVYGFATVRYQWEFGGRTTTQGGAWNVLMTFLLKPIRATQP